MPSSIHCYSIYANIFNKLVIFYTSTINVIYKKVKLKRLCYAMEANCLILKLLVVFPPTKGIDIPTINSS